MNLNRSVTEKRLADFRSGRGPNKNSLEVPRRLETNRFSHESLLSTNKPTKKTSNLSPDTSSREKLRETSRESSKLLSRMSQNSRMRVAMSKGLLKKVHVAIGLDPDDPAMRKRFHEMSLNLKLDLDKLKEAI